MGHSPPLNQEQRELINWDEWKGMGMARKTRRRRSGCSCARCRAKARRHTRRSTRRHTARRKRTPIGNGPLLVAWAGAGAAVAYLCRRWMPGADATSVAMVAVLGGLVAAALLAPALAGIWRSLTHRGR